VGRKRLTALTPDLDIKVRKKKNVSFILIRTSVNLLKRLNLHFQPNLLESSLVGAIATSGE
jgi:hypothetical protein